MPDDQHFDAIEIRPAERQVLVGGQPAAQVPTAIAGAMGLQLPASRPPCDALVAALAFDGSRVEAVLG